MLIELNLDERVISKIKEILEGGEYENEKEVIVRAIDNLCERTKSATADDCPNRFQNMAGYASGLRGQVVKIHPGGRKVRINKIIGSVDQIAKDVHKDHVDEILPKGATIPEYPKLRELNELDEADKYKEAIVLEKLHVKYFKMGNNYYAHQNYKKALECYRLSSKTILDLWERHPHKKNSATIQTFKTSKKYEDITLASLGGLNTFFSQVTYPDIKKIIESMPDEQNSTFKRCAVPSPEEVYGIEQTGLIWGFHNRFFPVKFIIHVLAKLLVEEAMIWEGSGTINTQHGVCNHPWHSYQEIEGPWIKFQRLTDEVKLESITASKMLNEMKVGNKFENIDPTIGFPSTKNRFLEKPKLREIRSLNPMLAEEKARALEETSKNRFLTQYVGRGLDRKNGVREVAGACFEMKLIQAAVAEPYGPKDDLYVTLTDLGKEFALLENPVIKGLLDYSVHHKPTHIPFIQFQKLAEEQGMDPEDAKRRFKDMETLSGVTTADYVEGVDSTHFFTDVGSPIKNTFSNEESDFILKNIIPEFELEKKVVEELLKSKEKLSVHKITEVFLELQKAHLLEDPDAKRLARWIVAEKKTGDATTIIKRMHELGLVKREQDGLQVSYTVNPR